MIAIVGVGIALSLASGTAQTTSNLVITTPRVGLQTVYPSTYVSTKYLKIEKYNIHIFGSATVSDWFMRESYGMIENVMGAMLPLHRAKFSGFQALLITNADPDLTFLGSLVGHRNTGNNGWSLFNEAMVGVSAVDTIYPNLAPEFRGWETPIHEFGHAVELTLGLEGRTEAVRLLNNAPTNTIYEGERYAWAVEEWFAVRPRSSRSTLPAWERNYLAEVFNVNNTWSPSFAPRPAVLPVGPLGFTFRSGEPGGCLVDGPSDAAFGANGIFSYRTNETYGLNFDSATFPSHPTQNVYRCGFTRLNTAIIPPAGYTFCANEGGSASLPGACDVAYGSNGRFTYLSNRSGNMTFNSTVFGRNPNFGCLNSGFYKRRPFTTAPVGPANYTWCSTESGSFTVPGVCNVAYGANGSFVYKYGVSDTVKFNNTDFGPDPIRGVRKNGFYQVISAQ